MPSIAIGAPAAARAGGFIAVSALTKRFPGVVAVDGVDLEIAPGEILALLGQNGAGKSTLIQVLSGVHPHGSYDGDIAMDGQTIRCRSVAEAEAAGIAFLAQEVNVAADLSVAEGLCLNDEPHRFGLIDAPRRMARARAALAAFELDIDPATRFGDLDLASQQLVLIARALSKNARLLILDEPTAALTEREAARLFDRMRSLKARGVAIIFVSHRLAEVFEISDRIVIMRDGRIGGRFDTANTSRDLVVEQMVGHRVMQAPLQRRCTAGEPALQARGLTVLDGTGREVVSGVDIEIGKGEVVGLFGLLGSGAVETAMALFGAWFGQTRGSISVAGKPVAITSPADAARLGLGLIAQDRRDGLSRDHSIYDNAILADLDALCHRGVVDIIAARRKVLDLFDRLQIRAAGIDTVVGTLSGGNQQKVQVARWLASGAGILLLVDPTRGVDVGARAEITRIWIELADAGCAILLVSSDAEELVEICDRAMVLRNGRVSGRLDRAQLTEARLLKLAAGI